MTHVCFSIMGFRFEVVGYGCATCVGNTAPLPESVVDAIKQVRQNSHFVSFFLNICMLTWAVCLCAGWFGGVWRSVWKQAFRRTPVWLRAGKLFGLAPAGGGVCDRRHSQHQPWDRTTRSELRGEGRVSAGYLAIQRGGEPHRGERRHRLHVQRPKEPNGGTRNFIAHFLQKIKQ